MADRLRGFRWWWNQQKQFVRRFRGLADHWPATEHWIPEFSTKSSSIEHCTVTSVCSSELRLAHMVRSIAAQTIQAMPASRTTAKVGQIQSRFLASNLEQGTDRTAGAAEGQIAP